MSFLARHPGFRRVYLRLAVFCSNYGIEPPLSGRAAWVEKGWRDQSDKTPDRDPALYVTHDESVELLFQDVLPGIDKDAAILEIGCNAGRNLNYLHGKGYRNLYGIEIGIKAEDAMAQHFPDLYKDVHLTIGNAYEEIIKLPSAHFELVFAHSVLVNIAPKWNGIFQEMARVARTFILTMESEGSYTAYPRDFEKMFKKAGCRQIMYKYYELVDKKRLLPAPFRKESLFTNNTLRLFTHNT